MNVLCNVIPIVKIASSNSSVWFHCIISLLGPRITELYPFTSDTISWNRFRERIWNIEQFNEQFKVRATFRSIDKWINNTLISHKFIGIGIYFYQFEVERKWHSLFVIVSTWWSHLIPGEIVWYMTCFFRSQAYPRVTSIVWKLLCESPRDVSPTISHRENYADH